MNYLDKLLDGAPVEWKPPGEVGTFTRGSGLQKKDFTDSGVGCIHYGQIYTHYGVATTVTKSFVSREFAARARKAEYGDLVIATTSENDEDVCKAVAWLGAEAIAVSNDACFYHHELNPKYVAYFFQTEQFQSQKRPFITGTKVRRVNTADLAKILIPIPPLAVQRRVVEILDHFTELTARQKQYEYYRERLLSFEDGITSIEWKTLGEVFETRNGYTPSKTKKEYWEGGTIPWYRMEDLRISGGVLSDAIQCITPEALKGKGLFEANSIILATTATIGEHALLIADSLANQRFTNFKARESLSHSLLPKFVYYYFFVIDEWCKRNVNVSNFPSVDIAQLKKQPIPIPPLEEQARIVSILDKFDTLTTSIREGLPREIELRQRQYEYYRETLLSFPQA